MVYTSWKNTLLLKPYAIAIDRVRKTVILSVRGTLSINDCMTDLLAGARLNSDFRIFHWSFIGFH